MTKTEAQNKLTELTTAYAIAKEADAKYNDFVNEGGYGYQRKTDKTDLKDLIASIKSLGFFIDGSTVYDINDIKTMRQTAQSLSPKNPKEFDAKVKPVIGVDYLGYVLLIKSSGI